MEYLIISLAFCLLDEERAEVLEDAEFLAVHVHEIVEARQFEVELGQATGREGVVDPLLEAADAVGYEHEWLGVDVV